MSRIVNPYQTFRDNAGVALSNGTLEFFENGTTTNKIIYTDSDLTVEQSNPYTLDAYGRVVGDVFLDGTYSVEVKDSDGNVVRTVDDVESLGGASGGGSETVQGSVRNKFINGSCRFPSSGGSVSISGSYQESEVKDVYVKAGGTPTNGTLDQVKTTSVGTTGYAQQVTDLTTGAGGTVDYRFRFLSKDSRDLVNKAAVFQAAVLHNVGSSIPYTVSVYKASAEDNFTTVSLISASSGTSVSSDTATTLVFPVSDMGDCSNGVEVRVSAGCGAVTTKDFYIADISWRKGASQIVFEQFPYDRDEAALDALKGVNNLSDVASAKTSRDNLAFATGYLDGLRISSAADADHDITVATGRARDATDAANMTLSSALTKQIDAAWAEGSNAGGFPSGLTLNANTWYYFFIISKADGTVDAGFDTSSTAANLLADASAYTYYRYTGLVRTNATSNVTIVLPIGESRSETLTSGTSWPSPPVISRVWRKIVGAGGGGGAGNGADGSGNTVTGNAGTNGGASSFDGVSAAGGAGGPAGASAQAGIAPSGRTASSNAGGGGGGVDSVGGTFKGHDGQGGEIIDGVVEVTPASSITIAIGASGSGGSGVGTTPGGDGADGADGQIIVEYTL